MEAVQLLVEVALVGNDPHYCLGLLGLGSVFLSFQKDGASIWACQAGEHVDRSRLSGPVGAKKTEYLPPAYAEAHPIHRGQLAESFYQIVSSENLRWRAQPPCKPFL
jgi:hypothetical protein